MDFFVNSLRSRFKAGSASNDCLPMRKSERDLKAVLDGLGRVLGVASRFLLWFLVRWFGVMDGRRRYAKKSEIPVNGLRSRFKAWLALSGGLPMRKSERDLKAVLDGLEGVLGAMGGVGVK